MVDGRGEDYWGVELTFMTSSKYPCSSSDDTGVYGLLTSSSLMVALRYM